MLLKLLNQVVPTVCIYFVKNDQVDIVLHRRCTATNKAPGNLKTNKEFLR